MCESKMYRHIEKKTAVLTLKNRCLAITFIKLISPTTGGGYCKSLREF